VTPHDPIAVAGPWTATDLLEVTDDTAALDGTGRWMVTITFEGRATLARFATWDRRSPTAHEVGSWDGPAPDAWSSSLDEDAYIAAVEAVRDHISRGEVYQANICRVLRTPMTEASDIVALHNHLIAGNPAPHAGALRLPDHGVHIASASPELYLRRTGQHVTSRPIKGTGERATDLLAKDEAENVMIVDLVRNDLGRVCRTGTVSVPGLLEVESHPGLVHLVSTVAGDLRAGTTWPQILTATFPPGSVTGAPKLADAGTAELAVAIRTFWREDTDSGPLLAFGTGAGITWDSDARAEWRETMLKAARLLAVAGDREVS
jgi:para-aminobenzoate synthetase component 1